MPANKAPISQNRKLKKNIEYLTHPEMYEKSELKRLRFRRERCCRCCSWPEKKGENRKLNEVFSFYTPMKNTLRKYPSIHKIVKMYRKGYENVSIIISEKLCMKRMKIASLLCSLLFLTFDGWSPDSWV